tara:strand:- start:1526 stop:2035 length:510 start_codon:yes stop_codon:yes gene_type:complete
MDTGEFIDNLKVLLNNNNIKDKLKTQKFTEEEMIRMRGAYGDFVTKIETNSEDYPILEVGPGAPEGWYLRSATDAALGGVHHYPALYYCYYKGDPLFEDLILNLFNPYDLNPSAEYHIQYPRRIWLNTYAHEGHRGDMVVRYLGLKLPTSITQHPYLNWINENPFEVKQ